ncbi:MAG: protein kinase [Myxococcales bacterium]|nr:protein kinase [Myxococcales bacterium]
MGNGAMGTVWSARNEATDRDFALKLMLPDAARDPQRVARFFKEAKIAGRLRHRCIVEVYDLGQLEDGGSKGAPYLVMELLDGEPLDALLRRMGRIPAGTVVRLLRDLGRGLDVAHRQGIVHRDLKPANIFLHQNVEGRTVPKILDFGVSKLLPSHSADAFDAQETTVGTILGSPAYMSPEQTAGDEVDARADIWALGVIAYRCISGAFPFAGANFTALALAINTQAPTPLEQRIPTLPAELCDVVARCLSRDRAHRYPSAAALADALDDLLEKYELPTMELSTIVGQGLPSDLMKTVAPIGTRSVRPNSASTTRKVEETAARAAGPSDAPTAPQVRSARFDAATMTEVQTSHPVELGPLEATAAHGASLAVVPPSRPDRRKVWVAGVGASILLVVALALASLGGSSGASSGAATPANPTATAAPPRPAEPSPPTAASGASAASAVSAVSATSVVAAAPSNPAAPKAKPATKPAPPSAKPKDQPHDGLTNPGF